MASYRSTAAKVAEAKRKHPDQFCPRARCLWRTGGGPCPRHGGEKAPPCVAAMGCLCAGHARGNPADAPCDTREVR